MSGMRAWSKAPGTLDTFQECNICSERRGALSRHYVTSNGSRAYRELSADQEIETTCRHASQETVAIRRVFKGELASSVGPTSATMFYPALLAFLFALSNGTGVLAQGPPCGASRPEALCAFTVRPYSENACVWKNVCEFTAASNALIASNVERYDEGFPW